MAAATGASAPSSTPPPAVWTPLTRDAEAEPAPVSQYKPTAAHPLNAQALKEEEERLRREKEREKEKEKEQAQAAAQQADPLQPANPLMDRIAPALSPLVTARQAQHDESKEAEFIPWSAMKPSILQEYSTDQQIGITVSFISGPAAPRVGAGEKTSASRLEELEQSAAEEQRQTLQLTQKEYIRHIDGMHADMTTSWEAEDRVKTLKIAIQCAKLLGDTTVPKFYPSKFVLISEILDTFGALVFERIRQRRTLLNPATGKPLPERDIPQAVKDTATETCRNWFYKIASIRELMPRIVVEMAILRCYTYLSEVPPFLEVIDRLALQVRGIADPLVQAYVQSYLVRKARDVVPLEKRYLLALFEDMLLAHKALGPERLKRVQDAVGLGHHDYWRLFAPALEWTLHCVSYKADSDTLNKALELYAKNSRNARVLNHVISSLPPAFVSANVARLTQMVRECDGAAFDQHQLYRTLGVNLALGAPPAGQELVVLNDVWKVVTKYEDAERYMAVAEVFIEYALKHCSQREVNILLGDIVAHVAKVGPENTKIQGLLQSSVEKVLVHYGDDFNRIFAMDKFIRVIDLFAPQGAVSLAKGMLEAFARSTGGAGGRKTTDPVIISTLFNVSATLHDTVNALSLQDEVRQISRLICSFVARIDFGRDVEKQLNFYVDCRQCFANLDAVKQQLVQCVGNLAMATLAIVRGKHSRKTAPFIRACVSFMYITIPSMDEVFPRLRLYLMAAQIAMINGSVSQADALFRAAVTLVQEVPALCPQDRATEDQLAGFLAAFCASALAAPGHPDHGPFYLVQGLLKVLKDYPWVRGSTARPRVFLDLLSLLSAFAQPTYPYHYGSADANDALYRGDPDFPVELAKLTAEVGAAALEALAALKAEPDSGAAAAVLAVQALDVVGACYKLTPEIAAALFPLAVHARQTAATNKDVAAHLMNTVNWLRKRPGVLEQELAKKIYA